MQRLSFDRIKHLDHETSCDHCDRTLSVGDQVVYDLERDGAYCCRSCAEQGCACQDAARRLSGVTHYGR